MGVTVLACGAAEAALPAVDGAVLDPAHGTVAGTTPADVRVATLPARPGKAEVDPLLGPALVVAGTDADLAAVVLRLLRKDRLDDTLVGFVPSEADSAVAALWGLPTEPAAALELALTGGDHPVPLIRDDSGGVLVGSGVLSHVRGRAYCDDTMALNGPARAVEVHAATTGAGLHVTVTRRGLPPRRRTVLSGRAFQLACDPMVPVSDGVAHPRPMRGWTWYRHTSDLRLVRPPDTHGARRSARKAPPA